jgi:hypothetical protein
MPRVSINVRESISRRLNENLYGPPVTDAVRDWLEDDVIPDARAGAPRDKGEMADSLSAHVSGTPMLRFAGFRSNSRKFWFVHGRFSIPAPPHRRSRPHYPPANQSLRAWSRRHGLPVAVVQQAIAKKGTPIVPFLAEAVDKNMNRLRARLKDAETEIERRFRS